MFERRVGLRLLKVRVGRSATGKERQESVMEDRAGVANSSTTCRCRKIYGGLNNSIVRWSVACIQHINPGY